jgi:ankyrin repeat protein
MNNMSWKERSQALSNALTALCRSDSLSEDGLSEKFANLFERHGISVPEYLNYGDYFFFVEACHNEKVTEGIIRFILEYFSGAANWADGDGRLPLHYACKNKNITLNIVQILVGASYESVGRFDREDMLPLHYLFDNSNLDDTVVLEILQLLLEKYPESIRHAEIDGYLPLPRDILCWVLSSAHRSLFRSGDGHPDYKPSNIINDGLNVIKLLYDAYPEAICDIQVRQLRLTQIIPNEMREFLIIQTTYADQALDLHVMTTPDENGQLPLHKALKNNAVLGSIKLLLNGNFSAVHTPDNYGLLPLQVACQSHESAKVVQYLLDLDVGTNEALDFEENTLLHHACLGANYDIIALLLQGRHVASVTERNVHEKLPIDLLWESDAADRESTQYTESVFRLLKQYPDIVMNCDVDANQQSTRKGKKRTFSK